MQNEYKAEMKKSGRLEIKRTFLLFQTLTNSIRVFQPCLNKSFPTYGSGHRSGRSLTDLLDPHSRAPV